MKSLILIISLLSPSLGVAQDPKELFLMTPTDYLEITGENRSKTITETKGDLLKFELSPERRGEYKVLQRKKDEIFVGITVSDCGGNSLHLLKLKNNRWRDVTKDVMKPLGKADLLNILKVSPVTLSSPDQETGIALFYEFDANSSNIRLLARKQDNCEVSGVVYNYRFNGKNFEILK